MEIELPREQFHQMMRRLCSIGKRENLNDAMRIEIRDMAIKLANATACTSPDAKVTISL